MIEFNLRSACCSDAAALAAIYAPYVENTCISFEYVPPDNAEFERRIAYYSKSFPFLVCESESGEIAGYAYASRHGERAAYLHSADVSIYIKAELCGNGIGHALYAELFAKLLELNIFTVFASVCAANEASISFHKAIGFEECGVLKSIGYKHGQWLDLHVLQKTIRPYSDKPDSGI